MTDEGMRTSEGTTRRPLLKLAAGGAALASFGVAARISLHPRDDGPPARDGEALALSTHAGTDIESLHLALGDELLPSTGRRRWESRRLPTSTHSMVAFTWPSDQSAPTVHVRSRSRGDWQAWRRVPLLHDVPDAASAEGSDVAGTELVWIGRADGIQIRVDDRRPADLNLVLLYPARRPGDRLVGQLSSRVTGRESVEETGGQAPQPELVSRDEWGANESLRDGRPEYIQTVKQVHVHHTVNSNDYSREDVPALIRGMYAYHTQTLGWSDIGYNFLVDRFGRAFVGRAGGPAKLVRGAHTLGFNAESSGVSAIGNYDLVRPSDVMLDAIAAIAAWKLDPFDRNPGGEIRVESEGSDKYRAGRSVRLPVIDGHRDTNDTACPGQHLYDALPQVRRRAARIISGAQHTSIVVDEPATIVGTAHLGQELRVEPGSYRPTDAAVTYHWLRGDRPIRGARAQNYQVRPRDVGRPITCQVTLEQGELTPVVQTPEPAGPATAEPTLTVTAIVSDRRVVHVRVDVGAPPDVRQVPSGVVTITLGERAKSVPVQTGEVVARFGGHRKFGAGTHPLRVVYEGDTVFTPVTHDGTVRVT